MTEITIMRLRLKAQSEISARENLPSRNIYVSAPYITGKKVRGAILSAIRRSTCPYGESKQCKDCADANSCKFFKEIVPSLLNCTAALPSCDCSHPREVPNAPSTYVKCKICSSHSNTKIYDGTMAFLSDSNLQNAKYCDVHNEPFFRTKHTGPICLGCGKPLSSPSVKMRPATTMNNATGSVSHGGLYFSQVASYQDPIVTELTVATGKVVDVIKEMQSENALIQLGAGRARGWGIVELEKIEMETEEYSFARSMTDSIKQCVDNFGGFILVGRSGVGHITNDGSRLNTIPFVPEVNGAKIERAFGRTTSVTGWSMATNLQKPRVVVAEQGSVFFYRLKNTDSMNIEDIALLETRGIGQEVMRNSQLNQVRVWEGLR